MKKTLLIVDDEINIRKFIKMSYASKGYDVYVAGSAEEALKVLENHSITILVTDMRLPKMTGLELISNVKTMPNSPYMVMMTAFGDVDLAVDVMKAGAYDFLTKPFKIKDLEKITNRIFSLLDAIDGKDAFKAQLKKLSFNNMVGQSAEIRRVYKLIEKVAGTNSTVLLAGESGTGKDLVAQAIHNLSKRSEQPFIAINCTAIAETMLEAELFGFEKGAFTDAKEQKKGLFELADGGTIFFDEIGDMPISFQAKLLRVLQDKTFRRVGGQSDLSVDVRVVSATHQHLEKNIDKGLFREDLFYRLNVFPIELPALRERGDDIMLLAQIFIKEYSFEFNVAEKNIDKDVELLFNNYPWRGNIRELKNIIERIMIIEESDSITLNSLPKHLLKFNTKNDVNIPKQNERDFRLPFKSAKLDLIDSFEIDYLSKMLIKTKGNVTEASKIANLDRGAFQRLLRKHRIKSEDFRL